MPKYIVNTPTFNPIDFETRIKPMAAYADTFNKNLEALDQAGISGDAIGGLIDPNRDKELADVYNSYSTMLGDTVNTMLNSGDIGKARNNLRALRSKYANELVPIQQGYNSWQEAIKNYDAQKAKDPSLIGVDPRKYSISNYMKGQSPKDHAVSGQMLYSQGQNDAKAASARRVITDKWKLTPELMGQYFDKIKRTGFNQDELAQNLKDTIIAQRGTLEGVNSGDINTVVGYLKDSFNRIGKANGINKLDDDNFEQAANWLYNGILSGLSYNEEEKNLRNENFLNPLQRAELESKNINNSILRAKLEAARNGNDEESIPEKTYNTLPAYEITGDVSKYNSMAQMLADLHLGKVTLDSETGKTIAEGVLGKDPYRNVPTWQATSRKETYGDALYKLAKELGETEGTKDEFIKAVNNMTPDQLASALQNYQDKITENVKRYQVYISDLVPKAQEYVTNSINHANSINKEKSKTSFIHDAKGHTVSSIPSHGTFELPRNANEAKKGLIFRELTDKNETGDKLYISPEVWNDTPVIIRGYQLSLQEAMNLYASLLEGNNQDDWATASEVAANIMNTIATRAMGHAKAQSETDSKLE